MESKGPRVFLGRGSFRDPTDRGMFHLPTLAASGCAT